MVYSYWSHNGDDSDVLSNQDFTDQLLSKETSLVYLIKLPKKVSSAICRITYDQNVITAQILKSFFSKIIGCYQSSLFWRADFSYQLKSSTIVSFLFQ